MESSIKKEILNPALNDHISMFKEKKKAGISGAKKL